MDGESSSKCICIWSLEKEHRSRRLTNNVDKFFQQFRQNDTSVGQPQLFSQNTNELFWNILTELAENDSRSFEDPSPLDLSELEAVDSSNQINESNISSSMAGFFENTVKKTPPIIPKATDKSKEVEVVPSLQKTPDRVTNNSKVNKDTCKITNKKASKRTSRNKKKDMSNKVVEITILSDKLLSPNGIAKELSCVIQNIKLRRRSSRKVKILNPQPCAKNVPSRTQNIPEKVTKVPPLDVNTDEFSNVVNKKKSRRAARRLKKSMDKSKEADKIPSPTQSTNSLVPDVVSIESPTVLNRKTERRRIRRKLKRAQAHELRLQNLVENISANATKKNIVIIEKQKQEKEQPPTFQKPTAVFIEVPSNTFNNFNAEKPRTPQRTRMPPQFRNTIFKTSGGVATATTLIDVPLKTLLLSPFDNKGRTNVCNKQSNKISEPTTLPKDEEVMPRLVRRKHSGRRRGGGRKKRSRSHRFLKQIKEKGQLINNPSRSEIEETQVNPIKEKLPRKVDKVQIPASKFI